MYKPSFANKCLLLSVEIAMCKGYPSIAVKCVNICQLTHISRITGRQ